VTKHELIKGNWTLVAGALVVVLCVGLLAGWMLQGYDENIGFKLEAARIAEVLELRPGMYVGDIRAGAGAWSADMARRVGEEGQVYATAGPSPVHELYQTIADAGVDNVTVITRTPGDTGRLPYNCCDAVLLRWVYHDFEDRYTFAQTLFKDTKAGGRLMIIDRDEDTPVGLSGHGISQEKVIEEITSAGFELERRIDDWEGDTYALIFRKPATGPSGP
jgi:predicted methyltransferase